MSGVADGRGGIDLETLINPEPLDDALIAGLMTKRPRFRWYEIASWMKWRRAMCKWRRRV